ncbi:ATP synthase F0 subunit a (mitochondrion) [Paramicrosporidium saccamoebae]|uniref:ATP synthase subunit a n=1 Tax=Paramicrosporidium saccamoebae TaxID=1246581 RepID=A0A2H9TR22_9FUNG|nr:ATP synthase F0 subunit a [Paramicrosporidium saccamoebae]
MNTPLEQFLIKPIFRIYNNWIDFTITNSTIYLIIGISLILIIFNLAFKDNKLIKGRWGLVLETTYKKIEEIAKEMIPGEYKRYIPFTIILFLFILTNNLIGLVPYSFTTTAHFIVTITLSLTIMIGVTIIGVVKHKFNFINLFIPQGLNQGFLRLMIPLIFFIEVLSYLMRVISLSVRLAANLLSGHTLLKIIANFGLKYTISFPILLILPLGLLSAIYVLEIGVAIIQAYVFTLLTTTYIKDAELLH